MTDANGTMTVRYARLGLLGGFIATVLMDIVLFAESILAGVPLTANYAVIGAAVGGGARIGFMVHYAVGPGLGLLFGCITSRVGNLQIRSVGKGVLLGLIAGVVTIPFGCVPTALLSHVPVLRLVAFSALPHVIWGLGLGWIAGIGLNKATLR
jgi:hypothetical protein